MKLNIAGGRAHIFYVFESLPVLSEVEFSAFSTGCEDSPERLLEFAAGVDAHPRIYDDWKLMIEEERPDILAVDGPFELHGTMSAYALERGIHVFCEKPVALTMDDLNRVERAWEKGGAHIISMVGLRYEPPFQYALQLVRAGAVGKVKMIRAQKSYRLGTRPDYYRSRKTYGGTIPWVGSHALDWILAFSGSTFDKCFATQTTGDNFGYGELESACQCLFVMKNGVQASASIDFLRPESAPTHADDQLRITGTAGMLEVRDGTITIIDGQGKRELPVPPPERRIFSDFVFSLEGKCRCLIRDEETFELTRECLIARDTALMV